MRFLDWIATRFARQNEQDGPLKTRLVRNVSPQSINDTLAELEADGFIILAVYPRMAMANTKKGPEMVSIYDILVQGDSDPHWGSWGQYHG